MVKSSVRMGTVWDRTTEFISANLPPLAKIALVALFVPTSISGALEPLNAEATGGSAVLLGIVSVLLSLVSIWGQLSIVALALAPRPAGAAMATGLARLPAAIGVTIVLVLAALLLALPIPVLLAVNGFDFAAAAEGAMPALPPGAALPVVLYALVLVPLFFWLIARLVLVSPVVVAERRGLGAIARSFRLTRGLALRIVGVLLLYGVVAGIAVMAAQTVFGFVLGLVAGGDGPVTIASVITAIVVAAVSTIFSVLLAVFTAKLYQALADTPDLAADFA